MVASLYLLVQPTLPQKERSRSSSTLTRDLTKKESLVAESVLGAAVGTLPGDAVAGHAPLVFIHALLADGKAAPAAPAKG